MTKTSQHSTSVPPRKRRKWVRVVFALSLTMNLLVLGLVVGAHFGDRRDHGFDPRGPDRGMIRDMGLGPIASALPKRERIAIGRALRAERGSFSDNRAALKRTFDEMLLLLRAKEFDAEALNSLMNAQRDRVLRFGDATRAIVLARISEMSYDERLQLADRFSKNVRFDRHKRRD